jgi:tRNA(Ile)-lysidine synthase
MRYSIDRSDGVHAPSMVDTTRLVSSLANSREILIGVSGGADSMALLHMIAVNRDKLDKDFKVLHVDHQINRDSGTWAKLVQDYCVEINMPCEVIRVDVSKWGNNLEQAARKSRYDAFAQQPHDTILLAHHADDQVETFFLKLFRGSGLKGLRCMSTVSECWFDRSKQVARPLLNMTRAQIEDYVRWHSIPHVVDPSNRDISYDRNWIRHDLVPAILERNEIADINILKSISHQQEAYQLIGELADIDKANCSFPDGTLDWTKLRTLSLSRLKNLIIRICAEHNLIDVSTHHIEDFADGLINADMDSRNEMRLKGLTVTKLGKRVTVR